jgi:hypothetical protein
MFKQSPIFIVFIGKQHLLLAFLCACIWMMDIAHAGAFYGVKLPIWNRKQIGQRHQSA